MNTESLSLSSRQHVNDKQVAIWLLFVAAVIFFMIILGGVTRLTHSGLSMVDWNPIMGTIPPITEADWMTTFSRYQEFPEYQKVNRGMTLEAFKSIFYFEYFHRVLGRLIGLLFLAPFMFFWFKGAIRRPMLPQMIAMFVLGGLQGLLGWYMVKSGLVKDPQVSQYRLTAHLISAVLIYSYILWVAFGLLKIPNDRVVDDAERKLYRYAIALTSLMILMIASGGFVAGTKAGFAYSTFPLMDGQFIPKGMYTLQPFWSNWFENITTIQFNHRMFAYLLVLIVPLFCFAVRRLGGTNRSRLAAHLLLAMLVIQVTLGVATILLKVPVVIAASHQGGAVLLLSIIIFITREIRPDETGGEGG